MVTGEMTAQFHRPRGMSALLPTSDSEVETRNRDAYAVWYDDGGCSDIHVVMIKRRSYFKTYRSLVPAKKKNRTKRKVENL